MRLIVASRTHSVSFEDHEGRFSTMLYASRHEFCKDKKSGTDAHLCERGAKSGTGHSCIMLPSSDMPASHFRPCFGSRLSWQDAK